MMKKLLLISTLSCAILASSFNDFTTSQNEQFTSSKNTFKLYKASQKEEFNTYKKAQDREYKSYIQNISKYWQSPNLSTNDKLVTYSKDKKTRTTIDFKNNILKIETISNSQISAKKELQTALSIAVVIDTKALYKNDPLMQKLAQVKKPQGLITANIKSDPILSTVIFDDTPTKKSVYKYVNSKVTNKNIKVKESSKLSFKNVYTLNVKLPKDTMIKRSKIYLSDVKKESHKQNIPLPLIFAIIHSESSFNPMARSHIPAYGLMQIVPKSAGIDSYYYLYKKKKLVSETYLYNSKNNIEMGSAYLHILYYKYLKSIKNPKSRLYCTIAAYNTGAGNVAWAFIGSNNVTRASKIINKMSSKEVYNKLLKDLKYDEPKHYLMKVAKRMDAYSKVYGI